MAYDSEDEKISDIVFLIILILGLPIGFLVCWYFNIDSVKEYGWLAAFWHGAWVFFNGIRSIFFDNIYLMAPNHTTSYSIIWWISCITCTPYYIVSLLRGIGIIRKLLN